MIIKKNLKIIKTAVIFSLCMAVILPFCSFEAKCAEIRDSVFRLHILANSDSEEDQKLKLCVRDALLDRAFLLFDGITDKQEA
ncbi:MAG: stage II sporulation protein R, partial [Acutalibacteraceae bacterium]